MSSVQSSVTQQNLHAQQLVLVDSRGKHFPVVKELSVASKTNIQTTFFH